MSRVRQLTSDEARRTLVARLGPMANRVRQIATNLGARPYLVTMVWTAFGGAERGEGRESPVLRYVILPVPEVADLTSLVRQPFSAGIFSVGSIRVTEVDPTLTEDILYGRVFPPGMVVPGKGDRDHLDQRYTFHYEVATDGRTDDPPRRARFRLAAPPFLDADSLQWILRLDRIDDDPPRDGSLRGQDDG